MTDATPLASEQITQEDREAAATLVPLCFGASDLWKANVLAGYYDDGEVVQAFARHRIAALSATPAPSDQDASQAQGEGIARLFHDTYERLAPSFGYETRADTKAFDPSSPNGKLMIAVCGHVAAALSPAPGATAQDGVERIALLIEKAFEETDAERDVVEWAENGGGWKFARAAARKIAEVVAATPTPTIPAGMVAVPQVPIEAMIARVQRHALRMMKASAIREVYFEFLAAAPKQAERQGVEGLILGIEAIIGDLGSVDMDGYYTGCVHRSDVEHVEALIAALNAPTGAVEKGEAK